MKGAHTSRQDKNEDNYILSQIISKFYHIQSSNLVTVGSNAAKAQKTDSVKVLDQLVEDIRV